MAGARPGNPCPAGPWQRVQLFSKIAAPASIDLPVNPSSASFMRAGSLISQKATTIVVTNVAKVPTTVRQIICYCSCFESSCT